MNKQTSLLLVLGLGGTALYFMLKPPKKATKSLVTEYKPETPSELTSEIESASVTPLVEQVVPRFGIPLVVETSNLVAIIIDPFILEINASAFSSSPLQNNQ
jgi:hypothetical protein